MDELQALKTENQLMKEILVNIRAEKTAIDQICLNNIKENIQLRTRVILFEEERVKFDNEIASLKEKIKTFETKTENLVDLKEVCA